MKYHCWVAPILLISSAIPLHAHEKLSPDPAVIASAAKNLVEALGSYEAVAESNRKAQDLLSKRNVLLDKIDTKRKELALAVDPKVRESLVEELKSLNDELKAAQAELDLVASENEVRLAKRIACSESSDALAGLEQEMKTPTPVRVSEPLMDAAMAARGALSTLAKADLGCPATNQRARTVQAALEHLVSDRSIHDRQLSLLQRLHTNLHAISTVDQQHADLSSIVTSAGDATGRLARAGQGNFEQLATLAVEMQIFKDPETEFEKADWTKLASGATALVGGALLSTKQVDGNLETAVGIGTGLGALLYYVGDMIGAGRVPKPVRRFTGAIAANRMLGLAAQDLHADVRRAQQQAKETAVDEIAGTAPVLPAAATDAATSYLQLLETKRDALINSPTKTLSQNDVREIVLADSIFRVRSSEQFSKTQATFSAAVGRVGSARSEVRVYRAYVQSLRTAAERLRQLLGVTAEQTLCASEGSPDFERFCEIDLIADDPYALTPMLNQINPEAVRDLARQGNRLALQADTSSELVDSSEESMASIQETASNSWKRYAEAHQQWRTNVDGLVSLLR